MAKKKSASSLVCRGARLPRGEILKVLWRQFREGVSSGVTVEKLFGTYLKDLKDARITFSGFVLLMIIFGFSVGLTIYGVLNIFALSPFILWGGKALFPCVSLAYPVLIGLVVSISLFLGPFVTRPAWKTLQIARDVFRKFGSGGADCILKSLEMRRENVASSFDRQISEVSVKIGDVNVATARLRKKEPRSETTKGHLSKLSLVKRELNKRLRELNGRKSEFLDAASSVESVIRRDIEDAKNAEMVAELSSEAGALLLDGPPVGKDELDGLVKTMLRIEDDLSGDKMIEEAVSARFSIEGDEAD